MLLIAAIDCRLEVDAGIQKVLLLVLPYVSLNRLQQAFPRHTLNLTVFHRVVLLHDFVIGRLAKGCGATFLVEDDPRTRGASLVASVRDIGRDLSLEEWLLFRFDQRFVSVPLIMVIHVLQVLDCVNGHRLRHCLTLGPCRRSARRRSLLRLPALLPDRGELRIFVHGRLLYQGTGVDVLTC